MKYRVVVTVKDVKGHCDAGHKAGDTFDITGPIAKGRLCNSAFVSMFPHYFAMRFGAELPWSEGDKVLVACPDAKNPVIFEMRRERIPE